MALTPGTRLGVYDITEQIGAGGPACARVARELRRGLAEGSYQIVAKLGEGGPPPLAAQSRASYDASAVALSRTQ